MNNGDRELVIFLGAGIGLLLLLFWLARRGSAMSMQPGSPLALSPYTATVPGFPSTVNVTGGTYNINVPSTPLAWIAPYFPLFGFVGVDATQIYQ